MDIVERLIQSFENGEDYNLKLRDIQELKKMKAKISILEEGLDEIEYAMGKVGWNNSRVETTFDILNGKLNKLNEDND